MKITIIPLIAPFFALIFLVGCGQKTADQPKPQTDHPAEAEGASHAGHDEQAEGKHADHAEEGHEGHGEEEEASVFVPDKGIVLNDETRAAFGLELGDVVAEPVVATTSLTAQVYRTASEDTGSDGGERTGHAYATATLTPELAEELTEGESVSFHEGRNPEALREGTVWKVDETQVPVTGMAEVLVKIPDPEENLMIGAFLTGKAELHTPEIGAVRIPRSAVLDSAAGAFAYVREGEYLKRTPIKIGASNDEFVEITEGLYEGDEVAITAVQALYITELRATKGGGHSH